jgi:tetratricopeptide (TPR) repeat protein
MLKPTFFFLLSFSVCLLSPAAATDYRNAPGNSKSKVIVGNDQNRTALPGFNILGGGPKPVDSQTTKKNVVLPTVSALMTAQLGPQKVEAEKAYAEGLKLQKQGKLTEAAASIRRSLMIREQYFSSSDNQIPVVKEKMGEILISLGKQDDALTMLNDSLSSYAKFNGPGTDHRIKPLVLIGNVYTLKSNHKGALDAYNQAYMLTQRSKGIASADAMKLRLQLAECNRAAKSLDLAASLYNECFDLQKKNEKLIERDQLLSSLQNYADVLKELKKDDEAQTVLARIEEIRSPAAPPASEVSIGTPKN